MSKRILVIEGYNNILDLIQIILYDEGCEVEGYLSLKGIENITNFQPSLNSNSR